MSDADCADLSLDYFSSPSRDLGILKVMPRGQNGIGGRKGRSTRIHIVGHKVSGSSRRIGNGQSYQRREPGMKFDRARI